MRTSLRPGFGDAALPRFAGVALLCVGTLNCGDKDGAATSSATAASTSAPVTSGSVASGSGAKPGPSASAAPTSSTAATPAARPGKSKAPPFLYEAKKGDKVSYFLGTMHTAVDSDRDLNPVVYDKLDASKTVFFELDASNIDPMAAMSMAMMPKGETIKTKLKAERWKLLMDRTSSLLMPESSLEHMKPWFLGALLTQSMLPKTDPLDQVLEERARDHKQKLVFLETADQQLAILDRSFDLSVLDDMLGDLPKTEKVTAEMSALYLAGDADKLEKLLFDDEDMKKHPKMYEDLLFSRNRAWIPKLSSALAEGGAFVAVGAAHLMGDKGVPKLLEKEGFTFTRVPPTPL